MNMRGLGIGKQLRNGFLRIGVVDQANIERIEIIKGPSAFVYGESLPAGLVNIVTKKPKLQKTARLATRVGTNNLFRFDAEVAGPLTQHPARKTSYIVNYAYLTQDYDQRHANLRTKVFSGAVEHKFRPQTSLLMEFEYIDRFNIPTAQVPVKRRRANNADISDSLATEVARLNYLGPADLADRSSLTYNATFEHRFNQVFSLRVAGNWFKRDVDIRTSNVTGGESPPYYDPEYSGTATADLYRGNIAGREAAYWFSDESGYGIQADLLAQYWLANRTLENRTLLTFDFSNYSRRDPRYRIKGGSTADRQAELLGLGFDVLMDPAAPNYYWPYPEDNPDLYTLDRYNDNSTDVVGAFLRHQTSAWGGRFIVVGGVRYDLVMEDLRRETEYRLTGGPVSIVDRDESQFTPNIGTNFSVMDGVRGYANYAKSFFISSQTNTAPQYGLQADEVNEGGHGFDYGGKMDGFSGRLKFTLGGFYIVRENVRVTDENGESRRIGVILSRGLEFDATYRLDNQRQTTNVRFGYGYTNAKYTNSGNDIDRLGRRLAGIPEHNAYVALNQVWKRGLLKGVRLSLGVTYTGSSYPMTDRGGISTTQFGEVYILSHSGVRDIKIPDYFSTRASAAHEWRVGKWRHELSLSATNLLDEHYVMRNRRLVESFGLSAAYTIKL
jgi:outer membrane receptor protein involved in Fe transport